MLAVAIIVGYLLGSISFSILIAKKVAKIDIRKHGSGNAGATNALRVLGKGPGTLVLLLDAVKGIIAILLAKYVICPGNDWGIALSGLAAVLGHNWPIFFGFRGGKGVATTIGVLLTLAPIPSLISVVITLLVIAITRYVSLGSLVFMGLIPVLIYFQHVPLSYFLSTLLVALLGFIRHRENIKRLLRGEERKLGQARN